MTASMQQRITDQRCGRRELLQLVGRHRETHGRASAPPGDVNETGRALDGEAGHEVLGRQWVANDARATASSAHNRTPLLLPPPHRVEHHTGVNVPTGCIASSEKLLCDVVARSSSRERRGRKMNERVAPHQSEQIFRSRSVAP